ncbi:CGNR zinc finger domain-containing protein [Pseudonocardia acaciae]|uniref:CGNR zinc finger domain-containing protein n=1 Tax=Pseudonocardia acaciae TaxID=551276 RepID=UPI00055F98E6|nr:CGNR zinc finger domain-containing protein [Pseudonocardia acaciae]
MDFTGYRNDPLGLAVDLVNGLRSAGAPAPRELLAARRYQIDSPWTAGLERDLWAWAARLAEVFDATGVARAAELINGILADADITPHLTAHDGQPWHLHYSGPDTGLLARVRATTAFALASLVSEYGLERHGVCSAAGCRRVYADASRNASRRYCSPACANRSAVAAHRARRRAGTSG